MPKDISSLVIKAKHGDLVSRFNATVFDGMLALSVAHLIEKICTFFNFAPDTQLTLTYIDEDGDTVKIVDDRDLSSAVDQGLNPLRIKVTLNAEKSSLPFTSSIGSYAPGVTPGVQHTAWNDIPVTRKTLSETKPKVDPTPLNNAQTTKNLSMNNERSQKHGHVATMTFFELIARASGGSMEVPSSYSSYPVVDQPDMPSQGYYSPSPCAFYPTPPFYTPQVPPSFIPLGPPSPLLYPPPPHVLYIPPPPPPPPTFYPPFRPNGNTREYTGQKPHGTEEVEKELLWELRKMGFERDGLNKEILRLNEYDLDRTVGDLCQLTGWNPIHGDLQERNGQ